MCIIKSLLIRYVSVEIRPLPFERPNSFVPDAAGAFN